MNTGSILKVCTLVLLFQSSSAFADKIMTEDTKERLVSVCKALKSDSQVKLNRALKRTRISHHDVANGLVCNGMNSLAYALQNKAFHNVSYLADKAEVPDPLQYAAKKEKSEDEAEEKAKPN